jgi:hypothetical protein
LKTLVLPLCAVAFSSLGYANTITCLTDNSGQCSNVALFINVTTSGTNLTVANSAPFAAAIDIIYFDATPDSLISGITIGTHTGTVDFQSGGNPANLPSGNTAILKFLSDYQISSTRNSDRIDGGESLTLSATGGDLAALFNEGSIRLGLHIQSVPLLTDQSQNTSESLLVTASDTSVADNHSRPLGQRRNRVVLLSSSGVQQTSVFCTGGCVTD